MIPALRMLINEGESPLEPVKLGKAVSVAVGKEILYSAFCSNNVPKSDPLEVLHLSLARAL